MRFLTLGAAAFALATASGALGQGKGNEAARGQDRGAPAASMERGAPGKGPQARGPQDRGSQDRGPRDKGPQGKPDRGPDKDRGKAMMERGEGDDRASRRQANVADGDVRGPGNGNRGARGVERDRRDQYRSVERGNDRFETRTVRRDTGFLREARGGLIDGCPAGLAKKWNGCNPPGQVKDRRTVFGDTYRPSLFGHSNYGNGPYYYDNGYLFRGGSSGVSGYIPLLGGALALGNLWPSSYGSSNLPDYYVDYYDLRGPDSYRYADDVIYRVDPQTAAIQSIAALLTGDDFTVGQRVPMGYDVYNVPYDYRDRYYDTPEANYRYSDGYVYRVDPTTQLVTAVIDLLV